MIIVCPECSTRFRIHTERLKDEKAKVRCARCKHVFIASSAVQEEVFADDNKETPEKPIVTPIEQNPAVSVGAEAEGSWEQPDTDFSYDRFRELDAAEKEDDSFTFTTVEKTQGPANDQSPQLSSEDFSFTEEHDELVSPIEKVIEADRPVQSSEYSKPETPPTAAVTPPTEQSPQQLPPKKSNPLASIIRILLILILIILVAGGVLVYLNGPDQLNQTIEQLFGQQTEPPALTGQVSLSELEGRFINNVQAGELFLIRGEAINNYSEPRAGIQVKGVIFDPNGKPLLQKTVFCGNPLSETDLQSLSFAELEKMMGNQFGNELKNMKVDEGQSIPFDIVFKDLPQNLSEFSVKVTSSKPATR